MIYAVYYGKRFLLIPWVVVVFLEFAGSVAFGSICVLEYLKCDGPIGCCAETTGCFDISLLTNGAVSFLYSVVMLSFALNAVLYYRHCIRTGGIHIWQATWQPTLSWQSQLQKNQNEQNYTSKAIRICNNKTLVKMQDTIQVLCMAVLQQIVFRRLT